MEPTRLKVHFAEAFLPLLEPARHKAYYGGRGSAKSHHFADALVLASMAGHERIVGARQFQNSIADSSKELIEKKIKANGLSKAFKILEREIVHITTDSRFTFIGLERNPESVKSLEGATKCWVEEARAIKQSSMDILIPTIRAPGSEIWWSWNPKYKADPVDYYFRGPEVPNRSIIRNVEYSDNPWFYTTEMPDEKALMLRSHKKKHDHIWGGNYDETGDTRIFPNTKVGRLLIPDHCQPLFGMDFGFKNDPAALIKVYVLENTRQIYIAQESFGHGVSYPDMFDMMDRVTEANIYPITGDSSRPETIDYINIGGRGYNCYSSRKGPGSLKAGIEWLSGYEIIIDPDCHHMQQEAINYCWKVDPLTEIILPIPLDADNHGWDAVRYATEAYRLGLVGGTVHRGR